MGMLQDSNWLRNAGHFYGPHSCNALFIDTKNWVYLHTFGTSQTLKRNTERIRKKTEVRNVYLYILHI